MYGAFIGDIVGSKYEFDNIKTKDFPLFSKGCAYTDDTIMTAAVAKALMLSETVPIADENAMKKLFVQTMQDFGRRYPNPLGAYGARFNVWIWEEDPQPYNSCGNGSAMRVSPCALYARTLREAEDLARRSAVVSHDHPEGIKGAQAVAAAVFLAKSGKTKDEIRRYISENYYDLGFTLDEIRETYAFEATCQKSVPQAIVAFLESESFEDAIRNVISIGGDCDTTGAVTGSIAWTYYAIRSGGESGWVRDRIDPAMLSIKEQAKAYLPAEFTAIADEFHERSWRRAAAFRRFNDPDAFSHDKELYAKLTGKAPIAPEENKKAETDPRKQIISVFQDIAVDMDYVLCIPSVHAKCGTGEIIVDCAGCVRQNNGFPRDKELLVIRWVRLHRNEIIKNHRRANEGKTLLAIKPLEEKEIIKLNMMQQWKKASDPFSAIQIVQGDICEVKADVIVNPTDARCSGAGGLDREIHKLAGEDLRRCLEKERKEKGPLKEGGVLETPALSLKNAKRILHLVGPAWKNGFSSEEGILAGCYRHAMESIGPEPKLSIAFPCISTGAKRFPEGRAAEIALHTVFNFICAGKAAYAPGSILFVCPSERQFRLYRRVLKEMILERAIAVSSPESAPGEFDYNLILLLAKLEWNEPGDYQLYVGQMGAGAESDDKLLWAKNADRWDYNTCLAYIVYMQRLSYWSGGWEDPLREQLANGVLRRLLLRMGTLLKSC